MTHAGIRIGFVATLLLVSPCWAVHADEECPVPAEWFPVTPQPTNQKPNPDSDCGFYQWAWQEFLYVTQADPGACGELRFLTYDTPEDLFPQTSRPRFGKRPKGMLVLAPAVTKQLTATSLKDFLQVDSEGALIDRNGRIVYYAIHVNHEFVKFVDHHHFRTVNNIGSAPADLQFPKGCVELKSSWKILRPNDDPAKFLVKDALVEVLTLKNGKPTITSLQPRHEKVALVGLHVVGVVDGHPEFIWATFEHNDNAPDLTPGADVNGTLPVDATKDYTFYPQGTIAKLCNKKHNLTFVSEADQTFTPPTFVCRQFPFGGGKADRRSDQEFELKCLCDD